MYQGFATPKESRIINTNNLWVDLRAIEESWTDLPPGHAGRRGTKNVLDVNCAGELPLSLWTRI